MTKAVLALRARFASQLHTHCATLKAFRSNGMPWPGRTCTSKMAGLSGIAYALPALVSRTYFEQALWVLSAFLSIMADYVHIHEDSVYHGLDRVFASFQLLRCLLLGAVHLEPWTTLALAIVPMGCFIKGRDAKQFPEPSAWIFWHTLWHLSGGLLLFYGTHMMHAETRAAGCLSPPLSARVNITDVYYTPFM